MRVRNEEERKRRAELGSGTTAAWATLSARTPRRERRAAPAQPDVCAGDVLGTRQQCCIRQALHTRAKHAAGANHGLRRKVVKKVQDKSSKDTREGGREEGLRAAHASLIYPRCSSERRERREHRECRGR